MDHHSDKRVASDVRIRAYVDQVDRAAKLAADAADPLRPSPSVYAVLRHALDLGLAAMATAKETTQ